MAKKKKRKTRNRQRIVRQFYGENHHHLAFQGRHWDSGSAKALRQNFVYLIPVCIHNDLHNQILHDVPVPFDVANIWRAYQLESPTLDNVISACDWLIAHSSDEAFVACMRKQRDFFAQSLR